MKLTTKMTDLALDRRIEQIKARITEENRSHKMTIEDYKFELAVLTHYKTHKRQFNNDLEVVKNGK